MNTAAYHQSRLHPYDTQRHWTNILHNTNNRTDLK